MHGQPAGNTNAIYNLWLIILLLNQQRNSLSLYYIRYQMTRTTQAYLRLNNGIINLTFDYHLGLYLGDNGQMIIWRISAIIINMRQYCGMSIVATICWLIKCKNVFLTILHFCCNCCGHKYLIFYQSTSEPEASLLTNHSTSSFRLWYQRQCWRSQPKQQVSNVLAYYPATASNHRNR